jgi:SAM-dependent methyltransferase
MKDELVKQERFFQLGETYFWLSGQNAIVEQRLAPHLEPLARQASPRRLAILDLGCGPGNTLRRLSRWGQVYGIDYSLDALAFARTKGVRHVLSGDSTALPVATASIDCVLALDVLEHVADDAASLREIVRVLRPGGVFLFTVPAFMSLWRHHDEMYGHYRRYTKGQFTARVRAAGLEILACHFFKCAFFPPLWVLAKLERAGLLPKRDNFFAVPPWLNRTMERQIVWEERAGLARHLPFGVSLLCLGRR